ncbi:MAG: response regulator [Candidatus Eisenbacteria bacterium]|nr:response regulator [Candidatus Eisenbacteria bacterium]
MNDRIRLILVDDEEPARALLREYLESDRSVALVGECANGFEAVKAVTTLKPDLVFLDIQMPKLNGFEVLELLSPAPAVIFCTAHDEYAVKAFEAHAVDYLLKPVGRERLLQALERFRARRADPGESGAMLSAAETDDLVRSARPAGRFQERILIRDGVSVHVIPAAQIDYLEAQDDYVAIHAVGKTWLKTTTLARLAADLDPTRFIQIHRSCLLNLDRLGKVELVGKDSRVAILKDGRELPMSRSGYARLKEKF